MTRMTNMTNPDCIGSLDYC